MPPHRETDAPAPPGRPRLLPRPTTAVRTAAVGAVAGAALLAGGRWALPISPLPPPRGPWPVGTDLVDVEGPRRLPVQVWYPADHDASTPRGPGAPLFPNSDVGAAVTARYGVPAWVTRPLRHVRGHAVSGAPPAPVPPRGLVVVAHGWMGFRTIHADLAEQLASDGWVVAAADHVGGALASQHLDGSVSALQADLMPPRGAADYVPRVRTLVDRYAEDVAAVLRAAVADRLHAVVPTSGPRVLLGQSTGGGAAVLAAARAAGLDAVDDPVPAVDGVVGLDPWVEPVPSAVRRSLRTPVIAVRSDAWVGNRNDGLLAAMPAVELRVVPGAVHSDLTALGYLSPLTRLVGLTRCDPDLPHRAALAAVADVTAAPD